MWNFIGGVLALLTMGCDAHIVPASHELFAQAGAMAIDPAGHDPVVRGHERDLHGQARRRKLPIVGSQPIWRGGKRGQRAWMFLTRAVSALNGLAIA